MCIIIYFLPISSHKMCEASAAVDQGEGDFGRDPEIEGAF